MGRTVRDRNGETFELRPTTAGGRRSRPSLRELVDRQVSVDGVLDDRGNHDAFVEVLRELDPLRATTDLDFDEARALVREALASRELELRRPTWRPALVCDPIASPADSLVELIVDDDEEEVAATYTFEFELVDSRSNPVPNEPYRVELPDGQVVEGRLNARGAALITGITTPGNCTLTFPNRTEDEWAAA